MTLDSIMFALLAILIIVAIDGCAIVTALMRICKEMYRINEYLIKSDKKGN